MPQPVGARGMFWRAWTEMCVQQASKIDLDPNPVCVVGTVGQIQTTCIAVATARNDMVKCPPFQWQWDDSEI